MSDSALLAAPFAAALALELELLVGDVVERAEQLGDAPSALAPYLPSLTAQRAPAVQSREWWDQAVEAATALTSAWSTVPGDVEDVELQARIAALAEFVVRLDGTPLQPDAADPDGLRHLGDLTGRYFDVVATLRWLDAYVDGDDVAFAPVRDLLGDGLVAAAPLDPEHMDALITAAEAYDSATTAPNDFRLAQLLALLRNRLGDLQWSIRLARSRA